MKLNCKPGDLAVVVAGERSAGRIVNCVRLVESGDAVTSKCGRKVSLRVSAAHPSWHIEGYTFQGVTGGLVLELPVAQDSGLRPLRANGGEDETLDWAGKPEGVTA